MTVPSSKTSAGILERGFTADSVASACMGLGRRELRLDAVHESRLVRDEEHLATNGEVGV